MTEIDFIVLDLDGGEMLQRCVASIAAQRDVTPRLIIVDNGSVVPARDRLAEPAVAIEHIRFAENRGFAAGANAGIAAASAPLVALVNNDVTLDPLWSSRLIAAIASDARIAGAQSLIAMPDGRIDGAGVAVDSGRFMQIGHGSSQQARLAPLWGLSATATLYRRDALEDAKRDYGYFDERFFAYYEDVELSARLLRRGWSFARVDETLAIHSGSSSAHRIGARALVLRTRNRYFVARMHPGVGSIPALLSEDLRKAARALIASPSDCFLIIKGVVRGLHERVEAR